MKSVLIVTNSLTGGGAERASNILANELVKNGHEVVLIAVNGSSKDLIELNCDYIVLNRSKDESIAGMVRALLVFRKTAKELNPEVVILNCELPEFFWIFTCAKSSIFIVEHTTKPWQNRMILGYIVRKLLSFRGAKFVAVSNHKSIWPFRNREFSVIKNPILITPKLRQESQVHEVASFRLVFVGRLTEIKQPRIFLDVCNETKIKGLIIGEGPLRPLLEEIAKEKLCDVEFRGYIRNPWMDLTPNDLIIVTSKAEGDGMAPLEASMNGFQVLLLDTLDLRRIGFPDRCYAVGKSGLIEKCNLLSIGAIDLTLNKSEQAILSDGREPKSFGERWSNLLNSKY